MKNKLPERAEIKAEFMWNITDLYESDNLWTVDFDKISAHIEKMHSYKGKLAEGAHVILDCLNDFCKLHEQLEKCYVYANLRMHEDCANSFYQNMAGKSDMISTRFTEETAFIIPEILSLSDETHNDMLADGRFKVYNHFIRNVLRQKDHCLSEKEEEILAKASDIAAGANNIFQMFNDADVKFPYIKDETGEEIELTKGRYITFLKSPDREVRRNAYNALYEMYLKYKNTLAACYYSSVKADVFYAQTRKYTSSLAHALADDNIPLSVYDSLLNTVGEHLHLMDKYIALRQKELRLDELHYYDLYTPLVEGVDYCITFDEAKELIIKALAPLGETYQNDLKKAFESGWIDVYENRGKRGGAYSWGASAAHPYVLMNFNDTIDSLFTLAHEMGHAMHSFYTWQNQPYIYAGHKIFVAEVASTVNEVLLIEYMLKDTQDTKLKRYLINYYLEQFRATFFRQTMFAEFEKITHYLTELGEPLTNDTLCQIYKDLSEKYYSKVVHDKQIEIEWARIPHFYSAFYVYQYATGFSASVAIVDAILNEGGSAVNKYLDFLKKGNSEYSIDLLKGAGVDMTDSLPFEKALNEFNKLIDKFERL